ncbi:MAG TPA: DUF4190 domain-containing protein [Pirellulales bacterium]|nr:DUF4190 domain-containing protein [Pirellulales bacterium]
MSTEVMEDYAQYRALSILAVASCVLGLLSVTSFLAWAFAAIVPILGILAGLVALVRIRRNPTELTGQRVALAGVGLSAVFLCGGAAYLTYDYVTEVPPGYERLNYAELQPDPEKPGELFPPAIQERDGDRIFIKGYVYPGKQTTGIKQFVLCRDNGDCCFGGQPKLTDRVLVTLKGPLSLNYSTRIQRLAGTFHVEPGQGTDGISGVIYHLDADYLK